MPDTDHDRATAILDEIADRVSRRLRADEAAAAAPPTYTRQQLRDAGFYQANKVDIEAAARDGRITGD